ncbi:hypothetical protein DOT_4990 [Desulfosporosinus sp. OT]|nr:hypothetical protein DOT_4990 [Desulfosporosinus sp. OT]
MKNTTSNKVLPIGTTYQRLSPLLLTHFQILTLIIMVTFSSTQ